MQLGAKETENERFAHYLTKTYRKTASLIANTTKSVNMIFLPSLAWHSHLVLHIFYFVAHVIANANWSVRHRMNWCDCLFLLQVAILGGANEALSELAFQYGRNVGLAFQLVDDLLDFVSSADAMGKPTAADLKLGLATAPVLFACEKVCTPLSVGIRLVLVHTQRCMHTEQTRNNCYLHILIQFTR